MWLECIVEEYVIIEYIETTLCEIKIHEPKFKGPYAIKIVLHKYMYVVKDI